MPRPRKPEAFAYVDAYNLYYGLRKSCGRSRPGWRWLDVRALIERLVPEFTIPRIYYFTAYINPPHWAKARRQKKFLRALTTVDGMRFVYGQYRADPAEFPLLANPDQSVEVLHTEEKQTDVNLAVQLIVDGIIDEAAQRFVILSNDSDQVPPIRLLRERGLEVGMLNPHVDRPSAQLKRVASWMRVIRPTNALRSQFADELVDEAGAFTKPPNW